MPLTIAKILADTGLKPSRLDLELTEGILLDDIESIRNDLHSLVGMGVQLSIDDFGTGYSSLSYVKRLPVSRLKIDQSFVRDVDQDFNDAAIIRAIVTLGHSLNLEIVAEGVERPGQLEKLREEKCDVVQGYLFGKPMTNSDLVDYLNNSSIPDRRSA